MDVDYQHRLAQINFIKAAIEGHAALVKERSHRPIAEDRTTTETLDEWICHT
jgi:hypothetical protein